MGKVRRSPTSIAAKQIRRVQDSTKDIEDGINAVTINPCDLAADNLDAALDGYTKAVRSGKMERNLRAVTLPKWKAVTLAKVPRIAEGIAEAEPVLVQFHKQRNAWQDEIDAELEGMPTRTLGDNERRMLTQMRKMSEKSFDKSIA